MWILALSLVSEPQVGWQALYSLHFSFGTRGIAPGMTKPKWNTCMSFCIHMEFHPKDHEPPVCFCPLCFVPPHNILKPGTQIWRRQTLTSKSKAGCTCSTWFHYSNLDTPHTATYLSAAWMSMVKAGIDEACINIPHSAL